jgi:hypothetical protein
MITTLASVKEGRRPHALRKLKSYQAPNMVLESSSDEIRYSADDEDPNVFSDV